MKKVLLVLLSLSLIVGAAVACGGSDVENELGARGVALQSGGFDVGEDTVGDFNSDDGEYADDDPHIDWGSDITFDIGDITLPGEGEECNIDTTKPFYTAVSGIVVSIETMTLTYVTIEDADGFITVLVIRYTVSVFRSY
jgi:hypothetical protein